MRLKRQLYLWHRWLGIGLCLLMALWFVSGMVMLFIGYPKLTPAERLAHLPALPENCCKSLPGQWAQLPLERLRLTSLGGHPYYLLELADGRRLSVDAATGVPRSTTDADWALTSARQYAGAAPLHYAGQRNEDTWTHSRGLDPHRPLHRVLVEDAAGTWLYLSGSSGEVLLDASAQERRWNWLGAWLHWLYPLRGGFGFAEGWRLAVIGLSLLATLMAALGLVVGVLRWRFGTPYRNGCRSPYAKGWLRWHHVSGLLFGVLLLSWIFSGLMSMRPWGLTDSQSQLDGKALRGGVLRADDAPLPAREALQRLRNEMTVVELEWLRLAGTTYLLATDARGHSRVLLDGRVLRRIPEKRLLQATRLMAPGVSFQADRLTAFDSYYYARAAHSMNGSQRRPLPVLRLRFADAQRTWVYLDPASGERVAQYDRRQRIGRWLFNLLHSWDLQPLLSLPWFREGLIVLFSLGGLLICLSGTLIGWRRLRRSRSKPGLPAPAKMLGEHRP